MLTGSTGTAELRAAFRGGLSRPTAGLAPGFVQANLIAVPRDWAFDVLLFAQRNPRACPVLDVSEPGSAATVLAPGADLRTDLPLYRLWRNGKLDRETPDVSADWADDLVAFLIGCSFTFEAGLAEAGIGIRHIQAGSNVPMFLTNRECRPAGRLTGNLVVSMRPVSADRVADAVRISARFPAVHGAPVHVGDPGGLGIVDLDKPDFGDAVEVRSGEVPVFWACGVTPQAAIMASGVPFAVTHAPGYMFVTDARDRDYET